MDRLQIAIQKARAQRAAKIHAEPPGAARFGGEQADPVRSPPGTIGESARSLWAQLQPFDLDSPALKKNRLVAPRGGKNAAPYDLLRTRMLQQLRTHNWRRIAVVSPTSGCGKTTAVANLAFACARQPDLWTMVLDLDLRRPKLAELLGQRPRHGMEDILTGDVDFSRHGLLLGRNVAVGLNNGPAQSPSELLQSRASLERLKALEAAYDPNVVLIDLPPMMATDDNFGFLENVDAVLLMVASEQSTMEEIEVSLRQIEELTHVMGIVLNKCRYTKSAYGYDSKYY